MEMHRNGETLVLVLDAECGIAAVEEDAATLGGALEDPEVRGLEIDAGALEDMDTAYLQLLLAARQEIIKRGGRVRIAPTPPCLTDTLACYGLRLV